MAPACRGGSHIVIFCRACGSYALIARAAQPKLRPDNIDEVLKAMTLEEKANLLVGGSKTVELGNAFSGSSTLVPGAAGNTRAIPRLGIPNTVLADGPAGLRIEPKREGDNNTYYCTAFPVGTVAASAWETAAGKYNVMFSKNVNEPVATLSYNVKKAQNWPVNNVLSPEK